MRFNHGAVRQAGTVDAALAVGRSDRGPPPRRRAALTLGGDPETRRRSRRSPGRELRDAARVAARGSVPAVRDRAALDRAPSARAGCRTAATRSRRSSAARAAATWSASTRPAAIYRGFANSLGQRNWYASAQLQPRLELLPLGRQGGEGELRRLRVGATTRSTARSSGARSSSQLARAAAAHDPAGALPRLSGAGGAGRAPRRCSAGAASACAPTAPRRRRCCAWSRRARACIASRALVENTADGIAPDFQEAGFIRPDAGCR